MSIQFSCAKCSSPIEVDDEHANQMATCPYCNTVITVPQASTITPQATITARPADPSPNATPPIPGMPPTVPGGPPPFPGQFPGQFPGGELDPVQAQRVRSATSWGIYALVCAGVVLALFMGFAVMASATMTNELGLTPTSQPSYAEQQEWSNSYVTRPLPGAILLGMSFFAIVGVVLSIVSLRIKGTWQGIVAVIVCAPFALCACGGLLIQAVGALAGA